MEGFKRQFKYQAIDVKKNIIIFWCILIAFNILFYILNLNYSKGINFGVSEYTTTIGINGETITTRYMNVTGSNIIPIGIFIIVYNLIMYYESFPTVIGFSSSRKDFYLGAVANNVLVCFAMAVIEGILLKLDRYFVKAMGELPLDKFLMFNLRQDNILYLISVLFIVFLLLCALFNLLGAVLYKFGNKVWLVLAAIAILLGNTVGDSISRMSGYFYSFNNVGIFYIKFIVAAAVLYGLGWLLVRRQNIRSGK